MDRWKVVGLITVVVLLVFTFTIVQSCHEAERPRDEGDAPDDLQSHVEPANPDRLAGGVVQGITIPPRDRV